MAQNENQHLGFPDLFATREVKRSKEYCLQYMRAFEAEHRLGLGATNIFKSMSDNYTEWRELARAKQSPDQYKDRLGARKEKGHRRKSWRALNYEILPVAPRFVKVLIDKILENDVIVETRAIDAEALELEKDFANKLRAYFLTQSVYEKLQKVIGPQAQAPMDQSMPMPDNIEDVETHKDMFYKNELAMDIQDGIQNTFLFNNWDEIYKNVGTNLVELGVGGTKTWIDRRGMIRIRSVDPERIIGNHCIKDDLSDLIRVAEFLTMKISDLKQEAGNQFSEDEYRQIANFAGGKNKYSMDGLQSFYDRYAGFPYDHEQVIVMDAEWFSWDNYVWTIRKNGEGNTKAYTEEENFPYSEAEKRPIPDQEYSSRYPDRKIVRKTWTNVYRAKWIVGTNFIYDYGLATNIPKNLTSIEDASLSYVFQTTSFDSIIRLLSPVIHNCQINWLQYQNHIARSRPAGLDIEMSAFENLTLGRGGAKLSPREALQIYFDTGILLWRRKNWGASGNQWRPINELKNGIADAAAQHFSNIIQEIDFMRQILGLPQIADATVKNPDIGKAVAEMAGQGSFHAINYFLKSGKAIKLRTADIVAKLLPESIKYVDQKAFSNILGQSTYQNLKAEINYNMHDYGIYARPILTEEKRAKINTMLEKAEQTGAIDPEDAVLLQDIDNVYRAVQILRKKRRERMKMNQQSQAEGYKMEEEKNINSAMATKEADIEKLEREMDLKKDYEAFVSKLRQDEEDNRAANNIILEKVKAGVQLSLEEQKVYTELIKSYGNAKIESKFLPKKPAPKTAA